MYRIGIDLGGTNIAAGIVNSDFEIITKASVPTVVTEGADKVALDIANLCKKITADKGTPDGSTLHRSQPQRVASVDFCKAS